MQKIPVTFGLTFNPRLWIDLVHSFNVEQIGNHPPQTLFLKAFDSQLDPDGFYRGYVEVMHIDELPYGMQSLDVYPTKSWNVSLIDPINN